MDRLVGVAYELGVLFPGLVVRFDFGRVPWLRLLVLIEVLGVPTALYVWDVWRLPLSQFGPVYACKERMDFDLLDPVDAQSFLRICYQFPNSLYGYLMRSAAALLTVASAGMQKYFLQFCILNQVYRGVSEAKGG